MTNGGGQSIRLTLAWRDDAWVISERTELPDKGAPASDDLPMIPAGSGGLAGYWVEVQDESGDVLYRHVGTNPFFVATQTGPRPLEANAVRLRIVVPQLVGAARLVVWSPRPPTAELTEGAPDAPAELLTTIDLRAGNGDDASGGSRRKGGPNGRQ